MAISGDLNLFRSIAPHLSLTSLPHTTVQFTRFPPLRSQAFKPRCIHMKLNNDITSEPTSEKRFTERLTIAWNTLFPPPKTRTSSNAGIAKQRLKMILYSDRCEVSEVAKRKMVSSIVRALSDFVEIESQDKVQLNVSTDDGLGTVYSVLVPVRRVRPEYQESEDDFVGSVKGVEYKDRGDESGSVDVKFSFFVPDQK